MDLSAMIWTLLLLTGLSIWFYLNTTMEIDYKRHPQLIDQATGLKRKPSDLLDLSRVLSYTDDYINRTSAQERLYDLAYLLNFENPFLLDHSYTNKQDLMVSGWPVANQEQCGAQLHWILSQLEANKNYTFLKGQLGYELTKLMDSFGKPETGLYSGTTSWLGSYNLCNKMSLNGGAIKTRYCIARMRPQWWPKNEVMYPLTSIRIGICLPETCDSNSLTQHNKSIETLTKHELPEMYRDGLEMNSLFCLPDERSPLRKIPTSGRIYLCVVIAWLVLVIVATVIHQRFFQKFKADKQIPSIESLWRSQYSKSKSTTNSELNAWQNLMVELLACLSLRKSIRTFKTNTFLVDYARGHRVRVNLGAFDFFKVWMALFVVLGHSGYLSLLFTRSLNNRIDMGVGIGGRMIMSVARCVDTFFVFFGVLTTYTMMRKFTPKQLGSPLIWMGVNLGILLRITPIFMLVYWYNRSVSPYTGSGPWWDYGVDQFSMKGVCTKDSWWKSIPHLGSIGTPAIPSCNLPSWFIVSYAQISLFLPLITYLICKLPNYVLKFGLVAILSLMSALNISYRMYNQTSVKEEAFSLYGGFLADLLEKFESTGHITTYGRLGSVSVGCLTGYLLRQYEVGVIAQWPKWLQKTSTVLASLVAILTIVMLPMIGQVIVWITGRLATLNEFVIFNFIITLLWPILNALLIMNLATVNNHRVIMRFWSHTFWHVFNRLGLALFLVHWEILFVAITSYEQGPSYGFYMDVFKLWSYGSLLSILLAFIIHIFVETPLSKMLLLISNSLMSRNSDAKEEIAEEIGADKTKKLRNVKDLA